MRRTTMPITKEEWEEFIKNERARRMGNPGVRQDFLAKNITMRSSDSMARASMAIFFDVTGSMGQIPRQFANGTLLTLTDEIMHRGSIEYPEIMFGAIGDVVCDAYPLQATEFNTDIEAASQLLDLYIEGGGGGNFSESYPAAWIFAARKTEPASLKYGKKGILFTMGDEYYPLSISKQDLVRHLGIGKAERQEVSYLEANYPSASAAASSNRSSIYNNNPYRFASSSVSSHNNIFSRYSSNSSMFASSSVSSSNNRFLMRDDDFLNTQAVTPPNHISAKSMLEEAQEKYVVFHLCLKADEKPLVFKQWKNLLGDKAIPVNTADIDKVAEIIVSIIDRYYTGLSADQVASTWQDPAVQRAVETAIADLGTLVTFEDPNAHFYKAKESTVDTFLTNHGFSTDAARIDRIISNGFTALTKAVELGDYATSYELATARGANINAVTLYGNSALHIALFHFDSKNQAFRNIIDWLVNAGADLDQPNKEGVTPRSLARSKGITLGSVGASASSAPRNNR